MVAAKCIVEVDARPGVGPNKTKATAVRGHSGVFSCVPALNQDSGRSRSMKYGDGLIENHWLTGDCQPRVSNRVASSTFR